MKSLCKQWMIATEQLGKFNHVVVTLAHFFTVDGDHVVVHPVPYRAVMVANGALCNFTFVVRKLKVHAAAMYIKLCTQVFCCHGRAFNMPAGKTFAPGACPAH